MEAKTVVPHMSNGGGVGVGWGELRRNSSKVVHRLVSCISAALGQLEKVIQCSPLMEKVRRGWSLVLMSGLPPLGQLVKEVNGVN